jgi:hypothetical protein
LSPRLKLLLVVTAIAVAPLSIRAANRLALESVPGPGYLPSLELRRFRVPFDAKPIHDLRYGNPRWVFIGDSMLGTRIDTTYLGELSTTGREIALALAAPATGPGWWYLAFKNIVVASGVEPHWTFIFFRDTNLTDTMFRLESQYGNVLDRVARDQEPEFDRLIAARRQGVWARLHAIVNRAYELDLARMWMEPAIQQWFTRSRHPDLQAQLEFHQSMEETLGLDHLRADVASDLSSTDTPDFARDLPTSVLPELMRLSAEHHLPLCFVRVQRRPIGKKPPAQSKALRRYVSDLKAWIEANGGLFHDDTGDPEMTLDLYRDGDHIADRRRYTEIFRRRLDPLFRPSTEEQ